MFVVVAGGDWGGGGGGDDCGCGYCSCQPLLWSPWW